METFYIATALDNYKNHNKLRDAFLEHNKSITFDWTLHYHKGVKDISYEEMKKVGALELNGVKTADFIVVLLPGGRGTHVELGYALGCNKKIFIHASDPEILQVGKKTTPFYYSVGVTCIPTSIPIEKIPEWINS